MSNVIHANTQEFKDLVSNNEVVFVDFFANWCGPCKMLAPIVEQFADKHPEVKVVKIDVDQEQSLAMEYQVQSIPTLITLKNGQPVARQLGFMPLEALEDMIK
ncbi:MAG: thioredoxin [Erysipelotrichales bacterium]|nr:thioredoxin [Erysipelotrichales bacterium]